MLTNRLAKCAHLTITVSETKRDIGRKSSIFHTPLLFDAPVRGVSVGISPPRLYKKKLEWCGYPIVKKFRRYRLFVLAQLTNVTDGQTDRQTPGDSTYRAYAYASRGKN